MPNWCDNTLTISHEKPEMLEMVLQGWNTGKFFGTIYPEPDYATTPIAKAYPEISAQFAKTEEEKETILANEPKIYEGSWWDWRVQHWGTKWDVANEDGYLNIEGNTITASFPTAWSPPIGVYEKLIELGFEVDATYYESGCAFCGRFSGGVDETYSIDGDWKEVQDSIPKDIDEEYGISYSMMEWRADELTQEIKAIEENLSPDQENHELIAELIAKKKELEEINHA